jgi:CBS domain-containing protein
MRAEDVMTRNVVTIGAGASVREAARLLVEHRVSGLPVVDAEGRVVGLVTEADLIARQKGPSPRRSWWHRFLSDPEQLAEEYRRAEGSTVGDVMTAGVICVDPRMPIEAIAAMLQRRGIKRVPVMLRDQLVGIVSRADLVKALASRGTGPVASASDAEIVRVINDRLDREPWAHRSGVMVKSEEGVVAFWGLVESESERAATAALASNVPGVKKVRNYLSVRSQVLPYVYWASEHDPDEDGSPPELRKDPWDPQDPTARP